MSKSPPYDLVSLFAQVWKQEYGEDYMISPKDLRHAKLYLQMTGEEPQPDTIISRAKIYLKKDGVYADNRHSFTAFINNIGTFVAEKKKEVPQVRTGWTRCKECGERVFESFLDSHQCQKTNA